MSVDMENNNSNQKMSNQLSKDMVSGLRGTACDYSVTYTPFQALISKTFRNTKLGIREFAVLVESLISLPLIVIRMLYLQLATADGVVAEHTFTQ